MRYRPTPVLIMLLVLSACATTPSKEFVHVNPESKSGIDQIVNVAIIADVCLMKDVLGDNDYWAIQESRSAEQHMLIAAKTYLTGKGYKVSYAQAPFVGSFKNKNIPMMVCNTCEGEVTEKNPPLFEAEGLTDNPIYREALLQMIPIIHRTQNWKSTPHNLFSDTEIKVYMDIIARNTDADATLFLIGHGTIVSTGKQLTQGVTTGIITTALTLGWGANVQYDKSLMDTFAALVDNSTGEILWSNSIRLTGDGFSEESYYDPENWPKTILYHIPANSDHAQRTWFFTHE